MKSLRLMFALALSLLLFVQGFALTAEAQDSKSDVQGEKVNPVFESLPKDAKEIVKTQNNEYPLILEKIENVFGSLESFYEYGTLYINEEGVIVL